MHPLHKLYAAATMPWAHVIVTPDIHQVEPMPLIGRRTVVEIPLTSNLRPPWTDGPASEPGEELVVGTWGLLRHDKGIDLLLEAFETVAARRPARLVIAGDPGADEAYIGQIERQDRELARPTPHHADRSPARGRGYRGDRVFRCVRPAVPCRP